MGTSKCKGCGAEILFIKSPRGTWMPCDPELMDGGFQQGDCLITTDGNVVKNPDNSIEGFQPHWASCPNADEFKKKETTKETCPTCKRAL